MVRGIVVAVLIIATVTGTAIALTQFVQTVAATAVVRVTAPDGIEVFLDSQLTQPAEQIDFGQIDLDFFGTPIQDSSVRVWIVNRSASTVRISVDDDFEAANATLDSVLGNSSQLGPGEVIAGEISLNFHRGVSGTFDFTIFFEAEGPLPTPTATSTPYPGQLTPSPTAPPFPTITPTPRPAPTAVPTATPTPAGFTDVTGILQEDTTWTKAASPYRLIGHVLVPEGITLTIEPGVVVQMNGKFVQIDGNLRAIGTPIDTIQFLGRTYSEDGNRLKIGSSAQPWNESDSSGTTIQYSLFDLVSNEAAVEADAGTAPMLRHLVIMNSGLGVVLRGEGLLLDSQICDTYTAIQLMGPAIITRNHVCSARVCIRVSGGSPQITQNVIRDSEDYGIEILNASPTVTLNVLTSSQRAGLIVRDYAQNASSVINSNVIIDNIGNSVKLDGQDLDIDMTNNYWGTTDSTLINSRIHDKDFDFRLGNVIFEPFLTEPPEGVPSLD
jgi:hypothetical protein